MSKPDNSVLEEFSDELESQASKKDAEPAVVVFDALAKDEQPPEWAMERLVDQ